MDGLQIVGGVAAVKGGSITSGARSALDTMNIRFGRQTWRWNPIDLSGVELHSYICKADV